jgi:hypothetical protein
MEPQLLTRLRGSCQRANSAMTEGAVTRSILRGTFPLRLAVLATSPHAGEELSPCFVDAAAECEERCVGYGVCIKAGGGVHEFGLVLVLEDVRQREGADF